VKRSEPFIGITCDVQIPKAGPAAYELLCDHRYPELVKRCGGYPVLLPIALRDDVIRGYLDGIDGLIIVGGDDVDPRLYGERPRDGTGTVFAPRLRFERKLYNGARRRALPILGICYGMQLINVLEGGSLYQDIQRDARSPRDHHDKAHPRHRVKLQSGTRLGRILGGRTINVHSDHHQAVSRVAPGFRPVAFAEDGIIEAIEGDSEEVLAVQWHPERMLASPPSRRLFRSFVRHCRKRPRSSP
jgi:putative glutamine amidotransferase